MHPDDHLAQLRKHGDAIAEMLRNRPLDSPVPGCPGWDLADLGRHLCTADRWAASMVGTTVVPARVTPPDDPAELPLWFEQGLEHLLATFAAAGPDAPVPDVGPPPHVAAFWMRRRAHEHAIHRIDAAPAGSPVTFLEPAFAADGLAELRDVFHPEAVKRRPELAEVPAVRVVAEDTGDEVTFGRGEPVATLRGSATDLYLLLWNRIGRDRCQVVIEGDHAVAERLLEVGVTV